MEIEYVMVNLSLQSSKDDFMNGLSKLFHSIIHMCVSEGGGEDSNVPFTLSTERGRRDYFWREMQVIHAVNWV